MLKIGKHMSVSKGFLAMAKNAKDLGCTTFAFFTRNPRGFSARAIDTEDAKKFNEFLKENDFGKLVAHAPYTLNLCTSGDSMAEMLNDDIARMEKFPGNYYNFHPGTHKGQGADTGIANIIEHLNNSMYEAMTTTVLIETMAGKGTEVGRSFEEIKQIINSVKLKDKIGVCLDTCHVWDAGYDIKNIDAVLEEFDKVIGIKYLKAIHLNDSKNERSSHKDRHENLGYGKIGLDALVKVINHKALKDLPFILETPQDDEGHAKEIANMKARYVW